MRHRPKRPIFFRKNLSETTKQERVLSLAHLCKKEQRTGEGYHWLAHSNGRILSFAELLSVDQIVEWEEKEGNLVDVSWHSPFPSSWHTKADTLWYSAWQEAKLLPEIKECCTYWEFSSGFLVSVGTKDMLWFLYPEEKKREGVLTCYSQGENLHTWPYSISGIPARYIISVSSDVRSINEETK